MDTTRRWRGCVKGIAGTALADLFVWAAPVQPSFVQPNPHLCMQSDASLRPILHQLCSMSLISSLCFDGWYRLCLQSKSLHFEAESNALLNPKRQEASVMAHSA